MWQWLNWLIPKIQMHKQIRYAVMPLGIYTLNGMKHTYTQAVMPLFWLRIVSRFHLVSLDFTTIHYIVIVCQVFDLATWQSYFRNVSVPSSKTISNNLMLLSHGSSIQKEVVCNNINILWSAFFSIFQIGRYQNCDRVYKNEKILASRANF